MRWGSFVSLFLTIPFLEPVYNLEFTQNTAYSYPSLEVYRSDSQAMLESTAEAIMLDRTYGPISVTYNYFYHVKYVKFY